MDQPSEEIFPFLKHLHIPPEWHSAATRFLERGGAALVLGGPDTGKSTLSRYLIYRVFAAGQPAALVDLDLGQSHLGPPAALGLGLFPPRFPGDDSLFPDGLYFVGRTSPVGAVLEVAVGSRVLADQARQREIRHIVVNTSGLIQGPAAFRLKVAQTELLQPSFILGLARHGELDCLFRAMTAPGGAPVISLPVSGQAARKTMEERRAYREARFRAYFAQAHPLTLPLSQVRWRGLPLSQGRVLTEEERRRYADLLGTPVLWGESDARATMLWVEEMTMACHGAGEAEKLIILAWPSLAYRLVGLLDGRHSTLALGLILPGAWDGKSVSVAAPLLPSLAEAVQYIHVGQRRVHPQGQELE